MTAYEWWDVFHCAFGHVIASFSILFPGRTPGHKVGPWQGDGASYTFKDIVGLECSASRLPKGGVIG